MRSKWRYINTLHFFFLFHWGSGIGEPATREQRAFHRDFGGGCRKDEPSGDFPYLESML